jgi:hypothetical protein
MGDGQRFFDKRIGKEEGAKVASLQWGGRRKAPAAPKGMEPDRSGSCPSLEPWGVRSRRLAPTTREAFHPDGCHCGFHR